jgi:hypothetical protein
MTVLGRNVQTDAASQFAVGQVVEVYGTLATDGTISASSVKAKGEYVPGASIVMTKGVVTATHPGVGTLSIGSALVDYTALLSDRDVSGVAVGDTVEIAGIQPVAQGTIIANVVEGRNVIATTTNYGLPAAAASFTPLGQSAHGIAVAYSHGGGDETQYSHGGGDETQYSHGGGDETQYSHGGGDETQYSHGGGDETQYSHGGGDETQYSHGGGDETQYSHGGGDETQYSHGGGDETQYSHGGGDETQYSHGGGDQ